MGVPETSVFVENAFHLGEVGGLGERELEQDTRFFRREIVRRNDL